MKQKKGSNRGSSSQNAVVPVMIAGAKGFVDVASIPENDWIHHHGKTKEGATVNSLKTAIIGDSVLIQRQDGKTFSALKNDLEVMAVQFLQGMGYSVNTTK